MCDYDGQTNFYGMQRMANALRIAESGEVLIRRRWVKENAIPVQLQVLEPDLLDHFKNTPVNKAGGSYIIQGVEFDARRQAQGLLAVSIPPGRRLCYSI
jgi:capsid protein